MKKIVISMLLLVGLLFSQKSCKINKKVVKKLENIYAKEIKDLDYIFDEESYKGLEKTCQTMPNQDKTILALPYAIGDENAYTLSLILAIVDNKSKTIEQSYFHKDIAVSDAVYIANIELDSSLYQKGILKLSLTFEGSSRVNPYLSTKMFLYKLKKNRVKVVLDGFDFFELHGENDMCHGANGIHDYLWKNKKKFQFPNAIVFRHNYKFEEINCDDISKERDWSVKLEPLKFVYKNGKYQQIVKTKPIFDLKEIEANAQKGLKYKEIVLKAMLYEEPIVSSTLQAYNNIAYYLQKAGHNKEAIFLLKRIISEFPKRVVAYLNLGDAYWELNKKSKANIAYGRYISLMKKRGKEDKIPKYAQERYNNSKSDFEKGFVAVHKEIQKVNPKFSTNRGIAKPIAIVPWLQKRVFTINNKNNKIVKVISYNNDNKMEFYYFAITRSDKDKGFLQLFRVDDINKSSWLGSVELGKITKKIFQEEYPYEITSIVHNGFLVKNDFIYFYQRYDDEKHDSYYSYRYKLGTKDWIEKCKYFISDDYLTEVYNHKKDMYVNSHQSSLYIIKGKKEIPIIEYNKEGFDVGMVSWSKDDKILYFDNHAMCLACIWRYDIETKELSKIVPEHEAKAPFAFSYRDREYVVYIENNTIKVATPNKEK